VNFAFITLIIETFTFGWSNPFQTLHFSPRSILKNFEQPHLFSSRCIPKLYSSLFSRPLLRPGKQLISTLITQTCTHLHHSFGQEQGDGAIAAIGALTEFGSSGQAATLSGTSIQFLLASANPCGSKSYHLTRDLHSNKCKNSHKPT
jgi:hypothetical protein